MTACQMNGYSLQDDNVQGDNLQDENFQDDSSQDEWVQFTRYRYEYSLQDNSFQDTNIDTVWKSAKHGSLSLDDI